MQLSGKCLVGLSVILTTKNMFAMVCSQVYITVTVSCNLTNYIISIKNHSCFKSGTTS